MERGPASFFRTLFERDGLKQVFEHTRNMVVSTIIVTAGMEAVNNVGNIDMVGVMTPVITGYFVAGVGAVLILLNLADGLRRLSTLRWHFAFQAALTIAYVVFSLRMVQLIIYFRTH